MAELSARSLTRRRLLGALGGALAAAALTSACGGAAPPTPAPAKKALADDHAADPHASPVAAGKAAAPSNNEHPAAPAKAGATARSPKDDDGTTGKAGDKNSAPAAAATDGHGTPAKAVDRAAAPAKKDDHPPAGAAGGHGGAGVDAEEAFRLLVEGNRRYVASRQTRPNQTTERRVEVAGGQHPFAVVLGCADSRVPPEILFDRGLGDLFVVRVAGNVASNEAIGSIEYAVEHLGSQLVVVLGHERCGAVSAAADVVTRGARVEGHVGSLVEPIKPAVESLKGLQTGDLLDAAVKVNVLNVTAALKDSKPLLAGLVQEKRIRVVGGYYDLDTGEVLYLNA